MVKKSYIEKRNRLDRLIGLLKSSEHWTCAQLSVELSIGQRTLMRDLKEISEMGIPIESERGRGGGVRINKRYGLGKLDLNYKEIIDLLLALSTIEKLSSPLLLQNMKSIKDKISRAFPEDQRESIQSIRQRIHIGDSASVCVLSSFNPIKKSIIDNLHEAFFEQHSLEIVYTSGHGEKLKRIIEPHFLLLNWPVWYVLAWDHLRCDIRHFRIDRISSIKLLKTKFKLREKKKFLSEIKSFFQAI